MPRFPAARAAPPSLVARPAPSLTRRPSAPLLATLAALALGVGLPAAAADPESIEAGRVRAEAQCIACHGTEGITADRLIPSLAGQRERYLQWQIVFFRNGRRQSEVMNPIAADLSDEELRNLGAYFASLPRANPPAGAPDPERHARGKQVAARHRCAACHMDDFGGNQAAPAVAHQTREYTRKALADYRSSTRPSVGVAAMTEAAMRLTDEEIEALAVFLEKPE